MEPGCRRGNVYAKTGRSGWERGGIVFWVASDVIIIMDAIVKATIIRLGLLIKIIDSKESFPGGHRYTKMRYRKITFAEIISGYQCKCAGTVMTKPGCPLRSLWTSSTQEMSTAAVLMRNL